MPSLVICEKPSVARDVARALSDRDTFSQCSWGYQGTTYWVTAAAGHLVTELPPERYDERYKVWAYDDLPILPEVFKYQARDERAGERLRTIKGLIHDPEVTDLINAADAGREGEWIFKLLVRAARQTTPKPIRRAWFSSMTDHAIQEAFNNLRPDEDMKPLEAAAQCRSEADWYVGMNATRGATTTLGGRRQLVSLGRVQTPTLALVVNRDLAIENFVPEDFATLGVTFSVEGGEYVGYWRSDLTGEAETRFKTEAEAKAVATAVSDAGTGVVLSCETKRENVNAPKLFDLTSLQREANTRFGMTAAATLQAAQACYENHKVLSYPRTDSCHITDDMQADIPQIMNAVAAINEEFKESVEALSAEGADGSALVNNKKVTDHHGLLPVKGRLNLSNLSRDERRIFDLVAWRMLAALGKPQVLDRTVAVTEVDAGGKVYFRSAGKVEIDPGWRAHWPTKDDDKEDSDDDGMLCTIRQGEAATVAGSDVKLSKTKPPASFNEGSLLGAMSTAGKLVDDDELADAMKDTGLGTPATRAATIEKLIKVEYLERSGKKLVATAKGRGVILALGDHPLTQADLTGSWEKRLRDIEQADPSAVEQMKEEFLEGSKGFATEIVAGFKTLNSSMLLAGRKKLAACPKPNCEGHVVEGKSGWGCDSYRSKEEPGCGVVIWRNQAGKKVTEKQMLKLVADMAAGKAPLPQPPVPAREIADCPSDGCEGKIVTRAKSFGCDSWKTPKEPGCGFVIWRNEGRDNEVSEEKALEMIAKGETNAGSNAEVIADCPESGCGGKIVNRAKSFGCNSWKSPKDPGCGFVIWKNEGKDNEVSQEKALGMIGEGKSDKPKMFAPCPKARCKGTLINRGKAIGCNTWRPGNKGCGTTFWRTTRDGVVKTDEDIHAEIAEVKSRKK